MQPMVDGDGITFDPAVIVPIMVVTVLVVIVAAFGRRAIMGVGDELADLWRSYGPMAARRTLDHRPGLATLPWICAVCHSYNPVSARRCYKCDAKREEAEDVIDAELPAGPSAGLAQRNRTRG